MLRRIKDYLIKRWLIAFALGSKFAKDRTGVGFVDKIIGLSVSLIVFAVVGVLAIGYINDVNTTGWATNDVTLLALIPTFFILGIAIAIIVIAMSKKGK